MNMPLNDTNNYQSMQEPYEKHFAPNGSIISYPKLRKLVKHQINQYRKVQEGIQQDASYYLFHEPQAFKDVELLESKIEEWEWLLEDILEDEYKINAVKL